MQRSNGHPKPKIHLPRQHRLPLDGEKYGVTTNGYTPSSSGQSMPQKHIHTPDEPGELVTVSIESEKPSSGEIPRVCLASVCWHMDNVNGPRNGADASKGRTDESRAQADVSNTPNKAETLIVSYGDEPDTYLSVRDANRTVDETDGPESHTDALSGHGDAPTTSNGAGTTWISHGEGASTYLGARDAKRDVDETDGLGGHADTSNGQADSLYAANETATPANAPEHVRMRQNHLRTPDLPAGSATSRSDATDGFRNCADRSNACTHVQSIVHETETAANPSKTVSIRQIEPKPPDIPDSTANRTLDESDSLTSHADRLDVDADVQNGANKMETPADEAETISMRRIEPKPPQSLTMGANGCANKTDRSSHHPGTLNMRMQAITPADEVGNIRTRQIDPKTRNSPHTRETATPESTYQWKRVSLRGIDIYVPWNVPIDRTSRKFVLGRVEGGVEAIAPSIDGGDVKERACNRNGDDGDVNNTTSGGSVDSIRVEAARLAEESQPMHYSRRMRDQDLPVSSGPSTYSADHLYEPARHQCRHGRLKVEATKVSQMQKCKTAYQERARAAQPRGNAPKRRYGVHRPRHRCGKLKIERLNDKKSANLQTIETAYLECASTAQPHGNTSNRLHRVFTPKRQCGMIKFEPTNISQTQNSRNAHLSRAHAAQPLETPSKRPHRVHRPSRQR